MKSQRKCKLNLYVSKDVLDFAKDWSYVTRVPISRMLEEYLRRQQEIVASITPFQWFSDPAVNPGLYDEDNTLQELEEYISNREEEAFCRENPDHPRAKIRRKMVREYETRHRKAAEARKREEKEVIQRWIEVFPLRGSGDGGRSLR